MNGTVASRCMEAKRPLGMHMFKWLLLLCVVANLTACAHGVQIADRQSGETGRRINESTASPTEQDPNKTLLSNQSDLNDSGTDLSAIPLEVNRMVLLWIDYFQGKGRPHMERYLSRLTRYAPTMKEILRKEGLPEDLIYIALIESGFSSAAHSTASAVGYWQFIRGTGRHYNLQIDSFVDERRDFIKSTQAAADYFKGLYNLFGVWYLAIASYNVGENRVKNVVMKYHTRDFWKLARENKLPDETVNYVPKFLAARLIAKEPEKYGFTDIEYMPPLEYSEISFENSVDIRKLATQMNLDYDDLRDLNPSYKRGVAFAKNGKLTLRVPRGTEAAAVAAASVAMAEDRRRYITDEDYSYYRVRRGETIATVAAKFSMAQHELRRLNRLSLHSALVAGRRIRVPSEAIDSASVQNSGQKIKFESVQTVASVKKNFRAPQSKVKASSLEKFYVVRKGDTLAEIAKNHRISIRELTHQNRLTRNQKVLVGSKLVIPE